MDEETQAEQEVEAIEDELSEKPHTENEAEEKLKTVDFDNLKVEDIKVPEDSEK